MDELIKETAILVPQVVFKKAKELYNRELYESALEILKDNAIRFDIYENSGRMTVNYPTRQIKQERLIPKKRNKNCEDISKRKRGEHGKFV